MIRTVLHDARTRKKILGQSRAALSSRHRSDKRVGRIPPGGCAQSELERLMAPAYKHASLPPFGMRSMSVGFHALTAAQLDGGGIASSLLLARCVVDKKQPIFQRDL